MIALHDVPNEMRKLADRCAKASGKLKGINADDQTRHYLNRVASHLYDLAAVVRTTTPPTGSR